MSSAIKGAFRVNPYNVNSVMNALERVYYMNKEERCTKYKKDSEHVLQNTTYSWIKNFFIDLKRTNHVNIYYIITTKPLIIIYFYLFLHLIFHLFYFNKKYSLRLKLVSESD